MASRKEEKERLRQARLEAEQREAQSTRRRLWLGYAAAGVLTAAVVVGIVVAIAGGGGDGNGSGNGDGGSEGGFGVVPGGVELDEREGPEPPPVQTGDLEAAARQAGCDLRLDLPDEGNSHFSDEDRDPGWETRPPTSGDHFGSDELGAGALDDRAYLTTPPLSRGLHALEHGRVQIQYDPGLSEENQLAIKGVYDADPAGTQLFPNRDMPYAVAATAWQQLLGCRSYDGQATLDAVRAFRAEFRGRGPEPVPF